MNIAHLERRPPQLIRALETLALRPDHADAACDLRHDLAGITVLVARKFTNDRTADGLLEAHYLTIGCVSLGLSMADIEHDAESELACLLNSGAEQVFQTGFRHIRELASLPAHTIVTDFDSDPFIVQRNIKALNAELCRAEPDSDWTGDLAFKKELEIRRDNLSIVECAKWLRKRHYTGDVQDSILDANAVIAIAVMFSILNDRYIVARTGQQEIEKLIRRVRASKPDIEPGWRALLEMVPVKYHALLTERMDEYRDTLIKKIQSRASMKSVVSEINYYIGTELDVDY